MLNPFVLFLLGLLLRGSLERWHEGLRRVLPTDTRNHVLVPEGVLRARGRWRRLDGKLHLSFKCQTIESVICKYLVITVFVHPSEDMYGGINTLHVAVMFLEKNRFELVRSERKDWLVVFLVCVRVCAESNP